MLRRFTCLLLLSSACALSQPALRPPTAPVRTQLIHQHDDERPDDYAYLRDKADSATLPYLRAENAYADAVMAPSQGLQATLYRELLGHVQETDTSAPWHKGTHRYYRRLIAGQQYPVYCRQKDTPGAPEEVLLDQNALARGHAFFSIGARVVSDDERSLAYLTDDTGYRQYVLHVRDLEVGTEGAEAIPRVTSMAWAADSRTLFYVTEDATTKRPDTLWRHVRGSPAPDAVVLREADERFDLDLERSRSGDYLFLNSESHTTNEVRLLPAARPLDPWTVIEPRVPERLYRVEHRLAQLWILVNDTGPNFRLVSTPVATTGRAHWREELAQSPAVSLEGLDVFAHHLVLSERREGLPHLRVRPLDTAGADREVRFPDPTYSLTHDVNAEPDVSVFRFQYESLATPASTFALDLHTGALQLLKRQSVPGGFDPARYETKYLHASAADGTAIPISLVYRKPLRLDGPRPLFVTGYGAYGISSDANFDATRLPLLDRGFVFAILHVRGGGEGGRAWHEGGRMRNKARTFTDFIDATAFLQSLGYGRPGSTVASGRSAGGLLMGAIANQRPDLFRALLASVPFVDVLDTMSDASLPLTVGEHEEWGNPADAEQYRWMRAYSPYDNVRAQPYPALLVRTSLNDSQVGFWEPAKWVARLRARKTDTRPLLFKVKLEPGGHGGASGRYDRLRDVAFDQAFVLGQLPH